MRSLTNFRYELHVLLELAQLLRGGGGQGVVAESAAVEVEVGDVRVRVGEGDGDVAQHHGARHLLVERRTLDSLHRAGTLEVSAKSGQVMCRFVTLCWHLCAFDHKNIQTLMQNSRGC